MERLKFGELLNFGDWQVLLGHVPLSMHIMVQNGRLLFSQMAIKTSNLHFNPLQNFPLYGIVHVNMYSDTIYSVAF